jgi:transposase
MEAAMYDDFLALLGYKTNPSQCYLQGNTHHIEIELRQQIAVCPQCGALLPEGSGYWRSFTDLPQSGKYVKIDLFVPKRYCTFCKVSHRDPLPGLSTSHRATQRTIKRIHEYFESRQSDVWIAYEIGISLRTVRRIRREWGETKDASRELLCPEYLSFDEIYPESGEKKKKNPYCHIGDVGKGFLLEFFKGTSHEALRSFLLSLKHPENLKAGVMDFTGPFSDLFNECFPGKPIVRDKAHVLKEARERFDKIRNLVANEFVDQAEVSLREANRVPMPPELRKQLLKREQDRRGSIRQRMIDDMYLFTAPYSELSGYRKAKVRYWLREFPRLQQSHSFLQQFYQLYKQKISAAEARTIFKKMRARLGEQGKSDWRPFLVGIIDKYADEIWAYFDSRLTNGFAEAMNRTIRHIIATSRHVSFDALRAKLLYTVAPSYFVEGRDRRVKPNLQAPGRQVPHPPRFGRQKKPRIDPEGYVGGLFDSAH